MNIDLQDFKSSYMTDKVVILFREDPNLKSIASARQLLDRVTDTLVMEAINESTP